jgi:GT2 family glycosyltransferase
VIVPNYNGPDRFFEDLTRGLHHAHRRPVEVVFIDDASDAEGLARLHRAAEAMAPVPARVIASPENRGPAHARNLGIAAIATPYVCAHDNDNIVGNRFFELACRILDENPDVAAVTAWMHMFYDGQDWSVHGPDPTAQLYRPVGPDVGLGFQENCFGDALAVYRTDAVRAMGGWDTSTQGRREDRQLFLRLTASGRQVLVLPMVAFFYRVHPRSRMRTIPEFDGWIGLGRALPGLPRNQAFGLVRATNTPPAIAPVPVSDDVPPPAEPSPDVAALAARLEAIESSTTWRASAALRAFVTRRRWLHGALRAIAGLVRP